MKALTNGPVKQLSSTCFSFCTFRTVNEKLAIDRGRWYDIAHENRKLMYHDRSSLNYAIFTEMINLKR